jgi:peptidoglycan/LPS O-acetylase OafA/YrhL
LPKKRAGSHLPVSSVAVSLASVPGAIATRSSGQKLAGSRFYRPELDILRFSAFIAVFLHHALPGFELSHHQTPVALFLRFEMSLKEAGAFGVCLFLLLSAYLITELLERERQAMGHVHVRSFYARRILRIWPLYFAFLFGAVLLGTVVHSYRVEPARIGAFLLLAGNWYVASTGCGGSPIAPLWSISVEEQFYVLWPWIARGGRRCVLWLSLIFLAISWVTLFELSHSLHANRAIWVNSFVQFQFFALGALLSVGLRGRVPDFKPMVRFAFIMTGLLLWLIVAGILRIKDDSLKVTALPLMVGYALVALGCVFLFLGFLGARLPFSSSLIYLGKISYGLYVFHMLAIDFAWNVFAPRVHIGATAAAWEVVLRLVNIQIAAMLITILLAALSYRFLERPFLRMKGHFTLVRSRTVEPTLADHTFGFISNRAPL